LGLRRETTMENLSMKGPAVFQQAGGREIRETENDIRVHFNQKVWMKLIERDERGHRLSGDDG